MTVAERTPIVEMEDINVAFGGVHAVREVSIDLYAGEVIGLLGRNGAGKSTLMRVLSGAHPADSGETRDRRASPSPSRNPRDAKALNIETIYQTLALADNLDAAANLFLGRERRPAVAHARRLDSWKNQTRKMIQPASTRTSPTPPAGEVPLGRPAPGGGDRRARSTSTPAS